MDPWNSRPLDVHRWSDHPEVKVLVDRLWKAHFPADTSSKSKLRGPKLDQPWKRTFSHALGMAHVDLQSHCSRL